MTDPKTTAVARYDGPRTIDDLERYSRLMADGTTVLPAQYRRQPGAILFAVEYAKALDVSPVTAITGIHVIEGKPTASAGLISALIRRAGHKLRVKVTGTVAAGDVKATATLTRSDDPDEPFVSVWDLDRARRAGLLTIVVDPNTGRVSVTARGPKGGATPWETYTESMLKARAVTEVGRDGAEEVLLGVHYTPEELGAEVDESGEVVHTVTTVPSTRTDPPATPPAAQAPGGGDAVTPPPPVTDNPGDTPIAVVDDVRTRILRATTPDDLVALWESLAPNQVAKTQAWVVGDEAGAETTVFELFNRQGAAIRAENPLVDLVGPDRDGPSGDDTAPGGDDGGTPAQPDPWPVNGPSQAGGEEIHDAVVVEDAPRDGRVVTVDEAIAAAPRPTVTEQTYRSVLDRIVPLLDREQLDDLTSWCRLNDAHPDSGEDHCRVIVAAIKDGTAFSTRNRPDDPVGLVAAVLGGTVIEETAPDPRAEDRADAARATPAGAGPRSTGYDAFAAARAANRPAPAPEQ